MLMHQSGDLRAGLMPLPYKGADPTLFQLLGFVVQAGKEFATVADQKIGDSVAKRTHLLVQPWLLWKEACVSCQQFTKDYTMHKK